MDCTENVQLLHKTTFNRPRLRACQFKGEEMVMNIFVTREILARVRRNDGTDTGCKPLNPGNYQANKTTDGALEILQEAGESLYLLPFIWWEKMELGDILIAT